jgi:Dyp-type peroxidase family
MDLQEGIYAESGQRPPPYFCMMFLRIRRDATVDELVRDLGGLWAMLQDLRRGRVRDLPDHAVSPDNMTVLLGLGVNVFDVAGVQRKAPEPLALFGKFLSPRPTGGGPLLGGSGLSYASDVKTNPATEDVMIQVIADTQFATSRAVVETWKALFDGESQGSCLALSAFFQGAQRTDSRSWIDFHDGISNLRSDQRLGVIVTKQSGVNEDRWTTGGTYAAFLRIEVDLSAFRRLPVSQQEGLVGRMKLSGCPIVEQAPAGWRSAGGCPASGSNVAEPGNEEFLEPPNVVDEAVLQSHVQRANHHRQPTTDPDSGRIYRQGYEFLEPADISPGFRAGLNFVSFQDTPKRLFQILTTAGWLGSTNFGGDPHAPLPGMNSLLQARAGGIFVVPPTIPGEIFPGESALASAP